MTQYRSLLLLISPFFGIFFCSRLYLFLTLYPDKLSLFHDWAGAFIKGFRYDCSSTCLLSLISVILISAFKKHYSIKFIGGWLLYFIWISVSILIFSDIAFFQLFYHHLTWETFQINQDWKYLFSLARHEYPCHLLFLAGIILAGFLYWLHCLHRRTFIKIKHPLIPILICLWGISGSLNPFNPVSDEEEYSEADSLRGNLALNPFFSVLQSRETFPFMRQIFSGKQTPPVPDGEYPFLRQYPSRSESPNIIFVLLESWGYSFIDSLAGTRYGVTPNFDKIVAESSVYTHCYGYGNQSIYALQLLLSGIPFWKNFPVLGSGLEQYNFTRIGSYAKKSGYYPMMYTAYSRYWDQMDNVSKHLGFKEFYGVEDYPVTVSRSLCEEKKFGLDYEMYQLILTRLKNTSSPFFIFVTTASTHFPYLSPGISFQKYPSTSLKNKFLNLLYYADGCLGKFMSEAKQQPWFSNTLFIFTADHNPPFLFQGNNHLEMAHIPLVFYYPEKLPPSSFSQLCSQADIHATCLNYFGKGLPFGSSGYSLLHEKRLPFVISNKNVITMDSDQNLLIFSQNSPYNLNFKIAENEYSRLQGKVSDYIQTVRYSLNTNRWIPILPLNQNKQKS